MNNLVLQTWDRESAPRRVSAVLGALNRTQAQLAEVLGVSFVTVNRWVNGHAIPDGRSRKMLEKLEALYVKDTADE